jgi:PST family polysaccharide transporter
MSLRAKATRAVAWSGISQLVIFATQFTVNVATARLLAPEDFGLVAMVTVFTGFAALFVDMGLGLALVQIPVLERRHENTVFWLQLLMGVAMGLVTLAAGPALGWFYGDDRVVLIAIALSPSFLLLSLGYVQIKLDQRRVSFRRVAIVEMLSDVAAGIVAVTMAWRGFGAWSLVARPLVAAATQSGFLWLSSSWRPAFQIDREAARELWGFGRGFTMTVLLNYWTKRAGDLLVGRSLGAVELGYYNRSYALMLQPITQVTSVFMRVLFSVMSRVQTDTDKVRVAYLEGVSMIALVTAPLTIGIIALADPFIVGLLGEPWRPMTVTLQLFCAAGLINSLDSTAMHLFLVRGDSSGLFRWRALTAVITIASFWVGSFWGLEGVAAGYLGRSVFLAPWNFAVPGRAFRVTVGSVLSSVGGILIAASLGFGLSFVCDRVWADDWAPLARLLLLAPLGGITYVLLLKAFRVRAALKAMELVARRFRREGVREAT